MDLNNLYHMGCFLLSSVYCCQMNVPNGANKKQKTNYSSLGNKNYDYYKIITEQASFPIHTKHSASEDENHIHVSVSHMRMASSTPGTQTAVEVLQLLWQPRQMLQATVVRWLPILLIWGNQATLIRCCRGLLKHRALLSVATHTADRRHQDKHNEHCNKA